MNRGQTIFAQLMDLLPLAEFRRCVERYGGDYKVQSFSCLDQFLCLAFAQLTHRESLRDIETCLRAHSSQLYHMGFRGGVSRNTLAHANQQRDWRIYADFARLLIAQARALYQHDPFALELDQTVYVFDSTTIDLCLSLFPWAQFRRRKSAVKLHTLLDLRMGARQRQGELQRQSHGDERCQPDGVRHGSYADPSLTPFLRGRPRAVRTRRAGQMLICRKTLCCQSRR